MESLYQFLQLLPIIDQTNQHVSLFTCSIKRHVTLLYNQIRTQLERFHNVQHYTSMKNEYLMNWLVLA